MTTSIGPVRLVDYLPTHVLEVVIHTLDVAEAAGLTLEPREGGLTFSLALLGEIAVQHGDGAVLALAISGRRAPGEAYNVLG